MSWDPGALLHIMMILPHIYPIFTHNASDHPMIAFWWLATARDGLRTQRMHGDRWGFEPIMAIMKNFTHIYPIFTPKGEPPQIPSTSSQSSKYPLWGNLPIFTQNENHYAHNAKTRHAAVGIGNYG